MPGFLERRMQGQVPATQSANLHNEPHKKEKTKKVQKSTVDNRASIKVSQDIKKELGIVRSMENFKYDYEAIQHLVDVYVNNLSDEDRKRYEVLRNYL